MDRISFSEKNHSVTLAWVVKDPGQVDLVIEVYIGRESAYCISRPYLLGLYTDAASFTFLQNRIYLA